LNVNSEGSRTILNIKKIARIQIWWSYCPLGITPINSYKH